MLYLFIPIYLLSGAISAQETARPTNKYYDTPVVIGSSLTYIIDNETVPFHEISRSFNGAFRIWKNLDLGMNSISIFTTDRLAGYDRHSLLGIFAQYRFYHFPDQLRGLAFFPEAGGYKGNYCTCGIQNPYPLKGLSYISIAGDVTFYLNKWAMLDLAWMNSTIQMMSRENMPIRNI